MNRWQIPVGMNKINYVPAVRKKGGIMIKSNLTTEQKKADTDLWIIIIISVFVLSLYLLYQKDIIVAMKDTQIPVLFRVSLGAPIQFGLAGSGVVLVMLKRKESFYSYGLKKHNCTKSIFLCALCFLPYFLFLLFTKQLNGYMPFSSVITTKELLMANNLIKIIGLLFTSLTWGFFEGFNYVVISEKINLRYPTKIRWLNLGAISCALICLLIHSISEITTTSFIEMITTFFIIYGMLMVKEFTGNSWGCVFIFIFLWNAF